MRNFLSFLLALVFFSFPLITFSDNTEDKTSGSREFKDHILDPENWYLKNYNYFSGSTTGNKYAVEKAMKSVEKKLGVSITSQESINSFTKNNATPTNLRPFLTNSSSSDYWEGYYSQICQDSRNKLTITDCRNSVRKFFWQEIERYHFEGRMKNYALSTETFINGTLEDTNGQLFDIIVDLNIIDLLLFGDKMVVPSSSAPFDWNKFSADPPKKNNNTDNKNNNFDKESNNSGDAENNNQDSNNENLNNKYGFCADPDALFFEESSETKVQYTGEYNPYDLALGNIYTGDTRFLNDDGYIDFESFPSSKKKCKTGEKSFLQGRVCIPEFCNDVICIKISLKEGYRSAQLRDQNCVECHIEKGIKSLEKHMMTLGQNTPHSFEMEHHFITAFANLFKGVSNGVYFYEKPLPFLVYDEPNPNNKKEQKTNLDTKKNSVQQDDRFKQNKYYKDNMVLYSLTSGKCDQLNKFKPNQGNTNDLIEYCARENAERKKIATLLQQQISELGNTPEESAAKNKQASEIHHNITVPFLNQFAADTELLNQTLATIDHNFIREKYRSCYQIP